VAQPRFRGSDLRQPCCGPLLSVDGCASVHFLGAGNGARLCGAPTQRTGGWDRPKALRRHWGRPVVQPRVFGGPPCRFWCESILARSSRPTAPTGRVDVGGSRFLAVLGPKLQVSSVGPSQLVGPESNFEPVDIGRFWRGAVGLLLRRVEPILAESMSRVPTTL